MTYKPSKLGQTDLVVGLGSKVSTCSGYHLLRYQRTNRPIPIICASLIEKKPYSKFRLLTIPHTTMSPTHLHKCQKNNDIFAFHDIASHL